MLFRSKGKVRFQACDNQVCLAPSSVQFTVQVTVTGATAASTPEGDSAPDTIAPVIDASAATTTLATGPPAAKFQNVAFQFKMLFMAIAGVNVAIFYLSGVAERAHETGAGQDAPASAKVIALLSIFCWIEIGRAHV